MVSVTANHVNMTRKIVFYRLENGESPVEEFLDTLPDKAAQKVIAVFKVIEENLIVSTRFFKKLTGTEIWECRIMWQSDIYRILGFFEKNNFIILTNGFHKKTQKTPASEIKRAEEYMKDYKRRNS